MSHRQHFLGAFLCDVSSSKSYFMTEKAQVHANLPGAVAS